MCSSCRHRRSCSGSPSSGYRQPSTMSPASGAQQRRTLHWSVRWKPPQRRQSIRSPRGSPSCTRTVGALVGAKRDEMRRLNDLRAERRRIAEQLRKVAERRARAHHTSLAPQQTTTVTQNDGGYLSYPVKNTYITSPYGMRMNPVIHVYELHDGTDFHAVCGTPVYAAAPGRVTEEYFNIGYGNRLLMDNGYVTGSAWRRRTTT